MIENAISTDSFSSQAEFSTRGQDFNHVDIPTETGAVKTTSPSELPRRRLESIHVGRDSSLVFHQQVGESGNPRKQTIGECKDV